MKTPKRIEPLVQEGLVGEVLRQLMSGKEATVYVVRCGDENRCAKVYKDVQHRSFKQAAVYQEGRKVRNSRQARAMEKGSRYGRKMHEEAWQNAEVDALYRLVTAGVRVPQPHLCYEGVLIMDLVTDASGNAAPRLNDISLDAALAVQYHTQLVREVVKMLCAGIIHGDLSEYNILVDEEGPVIIDLPQAVNAAGNNQSAKMLQRDVDNLKLYFGQFAPELNATQYGKEIWAMYQAGTLTPDMPLTGHFKEDLHAADVAAVMEEIEEARWEAEARLAYLNSEE